MWHLTPESHGVQFSHNFVPERKESFIEQLFIGSCGGQGKPLGTLWNTIPDGILRYHSFQLEGNSSDVFPLYIYKYEEVKAEEKLRRWFAGMSKYQRHHMLLNIRGPNFSVMVGILAIEWNDMEMGGVKELKLNENILSSKTRLTHPFNWFPPLSTVWYCQPAIYI